MDDNIGNIIYIILLIIAAITGAIRQNNKKKEYERRRREQVSDEEKEKPKSNPLESVFERFETILEDEDEPPYAEILENEEEIHIQKEIKIESRESLTDEYKRSKETEEETIERKEKEALEYKQKLEDARELILKLEEEEDQKPAFYVKELLDDPNDLKKAVILSEIINRKY